QKEIYAQLNDLFLDEVFFMSVSPNPPTLIARSGVHDISYSSLGGFGYTDVWLEPGTASKSSTPRSTSIASAPVGRPPTRAMSSSEPSSLWMPSGSIRS